MQSLSKPILVILGAVAGLCVIVLASVNFYVQSAPMKARLERKLSADLGMPIAITSASLTPWSGLRLSGISVPQRTASDSGNFFEAAAFAARPRLLPLLRQKLIVHQVRLERPKIRWVQNADGEWRLPGHKTELPPTLRPETSASGESAVASPAREQAPPSAAHGVERFEVSISQLRISDGQFDFVDNKGRPLASLSGLDVACPIAGVEKVEGTAESDRVAIKNRVFLEDLRTPFSYTNGGLKLPTISTKIAGGVMNGSYEMQTASANSPFATSVRLNGVNLDRLISEAVGAAGQASGSLSGFLDVRGLLAEPASLSGSGQVILADGRIQQYDFLQMLGKGLQIEELMQLTLRSAQADYRIENGNILVDQLLLESPNLKLTARGTVFLNGKLDLNARLTINPKISRQLPRIIAENFTPVENAEDRYVEFDVRGTIDKPRTNLLERMVGRKIEKQAIDLIRSLFGKPKQQ